MKNKLLMLLMIAGLAQNIKLLSSQSEHSSYLARIGQQTHTDEDYDLYKKTIEDDIEYDSEDDINNKVFRMPSPDKAMIDHNAFSVHRQLALVVKTKHLKKSARHKYMDNLTILSDTPTESKGTILDENELKELLKQEKQERALSCKINCLLS